MRAPLTASWSKGRHGDRYPYYLCFKCGCASYGKSIRREALEGEFRAILEELEPSEELIRVAYARFEDLWNHRLATGDAGRKSLQAEIDQIEKNVDELIDRTLETKTPAVAQRMEERVQRLEGEKLLKR